MSRAKPISKNLSPAALSFVDGLAGVSESTRREYRYTLAVFESSSVVITASVLADYTRWLEKRKYAKATIARAVSMVRQFLTWLDAGDQLPAGVTLAKIEAIAKASRSKRQSAGYKAKAVEPELPQIVTHFDRLSPSPTDDDPEAARLEVLRDRAMMHTLYSTGGRVSEVARLTRSQVASGRASETLIAGKGNKQRVIFLTPEAMKAIREYCDARDDAFDALFIAHRRVTGKPLSRATVWGIVKRTARAEGLSKSISPHTFRHYRATQLLNEGMPAESVQAFLGHASFDTTRKVYAHTLEGRLRDQVAEFSVPASEAAKAGGDVATNLF